jgi:hypothetical protein
MVRSRVYGILAGYFDQNDHDTLRSDPVFKLLADRSPEDDDLASQPTLSRFENRINIASLKRLRQVFVDQFIASFAQSPLSLTFDLDAVDDPTHGSQQLTLFHAFDRSAELQYDSFRGNSFRSQDRFLRTDVHREFPFLFRVPRFVQLDRTR